MKGIFLMDMNIKDTLCIKCICLPMCCNKSNERLLIDCILLKENIKDTARGMENKSNFTVINFVGLKSLTIYRKEDRVFIYTDSLLWELVMTIDGPENLHIHIQAHV